MSQSPNSPHGEDQARSTAESSLVPESGSGAGPTSQAPWVGQPAQPGGTADQAAPGHYGPGYADPTRHYGDTMPGQPGQVTAGTTDVGLEQSGGGDATAAGTSSGQEPERAPDFRSEDVGLRPPDHAPGPDAPESENAALIFERS